jgi:cilia- and flagella-associated protein 52
VQSVVNSSVKSLSVAANWSEVLIACSSGTLYRSLASNLTHSIVGSASTSPITTISFTSSASGGPSSATTFFTGTASGEIRVWDVSDYACSAVAKYAKTGACLSSAIVGRTVITGWEDGFIRCYDLDTLAQQLWFIPNAHRGGVKTISVYHTETIQYFVTGGADGAVRIWRHANRELIAQYSEHSKAVSRVLIDVNSPNIIHSVSLDCTVLSYDLKTTRRIICHMAPNGSMHSMSQRLDSEQELITVDVQGRLLHWDIDYREPVFAVQDPSRQAIRVCQVSPTGKFLAFAGDDMLLKVLELTTGRVVALGQGHSESIHTLAWTPDERQLVTGGNDSCLSIWNFYLGGV